MVGGVMGGYWAIGRENTATAPARVMTIESTAAKIGRSMKKREKPLCRLTVGTADTMSLKGSCAGMLVTPLRQLCSSTLQGQRPADLKASWTRHHSWHPPAGPPPERAALFPAALACLPAWARRPPRAGHAEG